MIGIGLVQHVDDRVFGVAVDVGDEIVALLFDDVERVDPVHRAHDDLTRAAAGAKRHVDHCVHADGRAGEVVDRVWRPRSCHRQCRPRAMKRPL